MTAQVARDVEMVPTGKGYGVAVDKSNNNNGEAKVGGAARPNQCPNGICYHGGPVLSGTPTIYVIWYGNWTKGPGGSDNTQGQNVVNNFLGSLSPTPYEHIVTTYSTNGFTISGSVNIGKSGADTGSLGNSLNDGNIQTIVANQISSGALPKDTNGLYMVLTSSDVNETTGFCTQYCGWHTHGTIAGSDIKYAFVGNPDRCPSSCSEQQAPNGYAGADGMVSIIAHEQEEAISDPDLNAWYDRQGAENADKCAWTFGTINGPSGAEYNVTMGGHNYLIQRNWVNAGGGYCSMQ
jgi:Phosphate-induced protein 1 conserved region